MLNVVFFGKGPGNSFSTTFCVRFFKKYFCYIQLTDQISLSHFQSRELFLAGWSVGKIIIIIILRFRVCKSGNKNTDHRRKETCSYQNDHISLFCDSTMSSVLNFCFLSILLQSKRKKSCYNHFHNILRICNVLPNVLFITSETIGDSYLHIWHTRVAPRVAEQLKT